MNYKGHKNKFQLKFHNRNISHLLSFDSKINNIKEIL